MRDRATLRAGLRMVNGSPIREVRRRVRSRRRITFICCRQQAARRKQLTANFDLNAGTPVWSRDGKTIYFSTNVLEANEVFAADVATGIVKQLTKRGGSTGITEISRDGKTDRGHDIFVTTPERVYTRPRRYSIGQASHGSQFVAERLFAGCNPKLLNGRARTARKSKAC